MSAAAIYAKEVSELIKQAVQIANTKNRGDYLFSGTIRTRRHS
jgi:flagellin-like hook-associated protein FlgL